jgi:hypothetical protein
MMFFRISFPVKIALVFCVGGVIAKVRIFGSAGVEVIKRKTGSSHEI